MNFSKTLITLRFVHCKGQTLKKIKFRKKGLMRLLGIRVLGVVPENGEEKKMYNVCMVQYSLGGKRAESQKAYSSTSHGCQSSESCMCW